MQFTGTFPKDKFSQIHFSQNITLTVVLIKIIWKIRSVFLLTCEYTETKKFSNTSQIHIFITDIAIEINTNLILSFFFAADVITILSNTKYCKIVFVWSAVLVIKCFLKVQNVNILSILHVHQRQFWTVLVDTHVPQTVPRCYTKWI